MNHQRLNNILSQLPIACSGITHEFLANGISLSIFHNTLPSREDAYLHHIG